MAAVTPAARLITGEDLAQMPGVGPCELIEGRVVLDALVRETHLGWVLTGEVGVYTRRAPDTVRGAGVT